MIDRMRGRTVVLALAGALLMISCSTGQRGAGASARSMWQSLVERRNQFEGARSYAKIRVSNGDQRETSRLEFWSMRKGRMELSGLSPLGTALFTVYSDRDQIIIANHHGHTWWQGTAAALPEIAGVPVASSDLPFLLFALPPSTGQIDWQEGPGEYGRVSGTAFSALISPLGIAAMTMRDRQPLRIRYDLPSMPPSRVMVEMPAEPGRAIEVQHLDVSFGPVSVEPPDVGSYRQVPSPRMLQ